MEKSPASLPADAIRGGCSISFSKKFHPVQGDFLSTPPFSILSSWKCRDGEELSIDKYEINGSSPDLITVFYWERRNIVTLVKWRVNSEISDYSGDYYRVFAYIYSTKFGSPKFIRDDDLMKHFPAGFDGFTKDGEPVIYPFKDAASIRKKLRSINFN
ncbi:hypothetical protein [Paraburkholderia heleia]|uniref:hypothetical protein n=1 Tax=Paraburkholderia heleia TaxID=634127 RepID=UPI0012ED2FA8|nr:hypothetical protein [Paraburkholderia heleia]